MLVTLSQLLQAAFTNPLPESQRPVEYYVMLLHGEGTAQCGKSALT